MLCGVSCFQWFKDTNLKANHNYMRNLCPVTMAVSNGSKILIWKQITTSNCWDRSSDGCFQWFKDTNLKANHNVRLKYGCRVEAVSNGSKILIWKQITTSSICFCWFSSCFQWFKDTNLKANHNTGPDLQLMTTAVSNGSKILIWKQITTQRIHHCRCHCCFQWFKDTNLKANHNLERWPR